MTYNIESSPERIVEEFVQRVEQERAVDSVLSGFVDRNMNVLDPEDMSAIEDALEVIDRPSSGTRMDNNSKSKHLSSSNSDSSISHNHSRSQSTEPVSLRETR